MPPAASLVGLNVGEEQQHSGDATDLASLLGPIAADVGGMDLLQQQARLGINVSSPVRTLGHLSPRPASASLLPVPAPTAAIGDSGAGQLPSLQDSGSLGALVQSLWPSHQQ